jgi:hypothetical protein
LQGRQIGHAQDGVVRPKDRDAGWGRVRPQRGDGDAVLIRTDRRLRHEAEPWDSGAAPARLCQVRRGRDGVSDVRPHRFEDFPLPIHTLTLVTMGMQMLDIQNLEDIAGACADCGRWEFLVVNCPQSHTHALLA